MSFLMINFVITWYCLKASRLGSPPLKRNSRQSIDWQFMASSQADAFYFMDLPDVEKASALNVWLGQLAFRYTKCNSIIFCRRISEKHLRIFAAYLMMRQNLRVHYSLMNATH